MDPRDLELVAHVRRLGATPDVVGRLVVLMGGTFDALEAYDGGQHLAQSGALRDVKLIEHQSVDTLDAWDLEALEAEARWAIESGEEVDVVDFFRDALARARSSPEMLSRVLALIAALHAER